MLVALLMTVGAFSQTSSGSWNSRTATYTNTTHGITWQLIDDWTWSGRPILADGTLLKVRNDDTHILVSLSFYKEDGVVDDILAVAAGVVAANYSSLVVREENQRPFVG